MDLSHWKVLIVEDEADTQNILIPVLEHHNISVAIANRAEEAFSYLDGDHPNVIIIDLHLPGMDGWDILREIKTHSNLADIGTVAMTAYHSNVVAQRAIEEGFDAYFPKPISARTFVDDLVKVFG